MQVAQISIKSNHQLAADLVPLSHLNPTLVLAFGSIPLVQQMQAPLAQAFPQAVCIGCSTAGEISGQGVSDDTGVITAIRFDSTTLVEATTRLSGMADSYAAGQRLGGQLPRDELRAVLVLGQGVAINGSALIAGLSERVGSHVPITGGLAGDAAAFRETCVLSREGVHADTLVCVGLYGRHLNFTHGSYGGWSSFGPARKVTRCDFNVLYELDGEPALDVYKRYLGDRAKDLPASGLLFPFAMLGKDQQDAGLIRTILGMDEAAGSLTLAGDIDPDGYLRLMHASTDALVDGAEAAAQAANDAQTGHAIGKNASLALLVSCVGRKLVMGGRVDEEIEAVADVFGQGPVLAGFYSNGEISPQAGSLDCKLHNQTMTITLLSEN